MWGECYSADICYAKTMTLAQTFILITVIVAVAVGSVNTALYYVILAQINRMLPSDRQRPYFIFWVSAARKHRQLYPDSGLPTYLWICTISVPILVGLVILEWALFNHPVS